MADHNAFINPYNFVSVDFNEENFREDATEQTDRSLSGWLECKLITKTPLAIPDASERTEDPKIADHYHYPFMSIDEKPVIPGSSIRGVLRNMYEALTDSCLIGTDPDEKITYRTKKPFDPGLLKRIGNETWELYSAKAHCVSKHEVRNEGKKHGEKVRFVVVKKAKGVVPAIVKLSTNGTEEGILCVGEEIGNKKYERVFTSPEKVPTNSEMLTEAVKALADIIENYYNKPQINKIKKRGGSEWYPDHDYLKAEINTMLPVWYKNESGRIYLSPAAIGRTAYSKNMGALLGNKSRCTERKSLCKACRLFGMIGKNEKESDSFGSRIRVSDAILDKGNENNFLKSVTLQELSGPKSSYLPFYVDISGDDWQHGYDDKSASLRGRKIYWHNTDPEAYHCYQKTKRNATMDLIREGNTFSFKVFFDRISAEQLEELKWTLTLGTNSENDPHCFKVGHGKPIGLGSAKILISREFHRSFTGEDYQCREETVSIADGKNLWEPKILSEVLTITDLNACKFMVHYPAMADQNHTPYPPKENDNRHAAHQWFTANYTLGKKPPKYPLPELEKQNDSPLPWIAEDKQFMNSSNRSSAGTFVRRDQPKSTPAPKGSAKRYPARIKEIVENKDPTKRQIKLEVVGFDANEKCRIDPARVDRTSFKKGECITVEYLGQKPNKDWKEFAFIKK